MRTDKHPEDGYACEGDTYPKTYCGACGILSGSSYPTGVRKAPPPAPAPPTHYGKPPCTSFADEEEVELNGATVCAAKCSSDSDCPMDVPRYTDATPHCSPGKLPDGYCGLKCGKNGGCPDGAKCSKSGLSLTGVCVFPSDEAVV